MHHAFQFADEEHAVELSRSAHGYRLHLGNGIHSLRIEGDVPGSARLTLGGREFNVIVAVAGDNVHIHLGGEAYSLRYRHPLVRVAAGGRGGAEDAIHAPMPGNLVIVAVAAGDTVSQGQTLLVMESMKMETTIAAPRNGIVKAVHFAKGQTFDRDALLLSLEPQT